MKEIVLVTDSGVDLPESLDKVVVLPFFIQREGEDMQYADDNKLSHRKLMDYINLDVKCNVSKPTVKDLERIIEMFDIDNFYLYLPSTTDPEMDDNYMTAYNNVFINVHNTATYNTRLTGPALGLLLKDLQAKIELGFTVGDIISYLDNTVNKYKLLTIPNMDYMDCSRIKGVRSSKLYEYFGLTPLLTLNKDGELVVTRSFRKLSSIINYYIKTINSGAVDEDRILMSCSEKNKLDYYNTYRLINEKTDTRPEVVELSNTNSAIYGPKVLSLAYKEIL